MERDHLKSIITSTLVVNNKQSIDLCVEKIINEIKRTDKYVKLRNTLTNIVIENGGDFCSLGQEVFYEMGLDVYV